MTTITLKGLDKDKLINWLKNAESKREGDPVHSFIAAWIGFNYYYSTFAYENIEDFKKWSNKNCSGSLRDKAQWMYLVQHDLFKKIYADFRYHEHSLFKENIFLPIIGMLDDKPIPTSVKGDFKLSDLRDFELFQILYQIRNNLFHGSKDTVKNERDLKLSTFAGRFTIKLLQFLNDNTQK